jgi:hypothetical protein
MQIEELLQVLGTLTDMELDDLAEEVECEQCRRLQPPPPPRVGYGQKLPYLSGALDANGVPADNHPGYYLRVSDPEIATLTDGYLIPTGKKYGQVEIYGALEGQKEELLSRVIVHV